MKLEDIIKTKQQVVDFGHNIENNIITEVTVNTVAHFGNLTCFEILCRNVCAMSCYNNIGNLGFIVRAFIELFDLEEEDGIRLSDIKNVPCRLIFEGRGGWGSRCIGFGNFMEDEFVFTEDFAKIDE